MARLNVFAAVILFGLALTMPARAAVQVERWTDHISEASARFGIPAAWIRRVIAAESGGNTMLNGRPIESRVGAIGLMQLMPGTWSAMRAAQGLGPDPHDPRDNILAGTAYLRLMYDRFGYPGLFAAYNAGPGAYAAYLSGSRRLPAETIAYVAQVARSGGPREFARPARLSARGASPRGVSVARAESPSLFVVRGGAVDAAAARPLARPPQPGAALFFVLDAGR